MKRTLSLFGGAITALAVLAGCGGGDAPAPKSGTPGAAATPAKAPENVLNAPKVAQAPAIDGTAESIWDSLPPIELKAKHKAGFLQAFIGVQDGSIFNGVYKALKCFNAPLKYVDISA